jgi:hypothetical protein
MPNYRFYFLLKAIELCAELKSLGGAFLAAKEKGDTDLGRDDDRQYAFVQASSPYDQQFAKTAGGARWRARSR